MWRWSLRIGGLVLLGAGVVYGVLGLWGMDRRGQGAWVLALGGVAAAMMGAFLIGRTWRGGPS